MACFQKCDGDLQPDDSSSGKTDISSERLLLVGRLPNDDDTGTVWFILLMHPLGEHVVELVASMILRRGVITTPFAV